MREALVWFSIVGGAVLAAIVVAGIWGARIADLFTSSKEKP